VLARLGRALTARQERRHPAPDTAATWEAWWQDAAADPALAGLVGPREQLQLDAGHHGSPTGLLETHESALRAAGFAEVGTLWQHGDNRLLCGVLAR
jgi:hypothetical protein